ncbi:MAG: NADH-quinone oxidoreductase subunit N, partial [Thermomicrobiaceae bacterium]|nr:NADH-quinone oxidoreductase subunit N [Thermomicrobiaceae bacterium]
MPLQLVSPDWRLILPELVVLGTILVVLLGDLALPARRQGALTWLAMIGLALALVSNLAVDWAASQTTFNGMFHADYFSLFVNIVVLAAGIMSVMISASYVQGTDEPGTMPLPEYYALLLFSILGTMLVGAAGNLLMIFLGIEMG